MRGKFPAQARFRPAPIASPQAEPFGQLERPNTRRRVHPISEKRCIRSKEETRTCSADFLSLPSRRSRSVPPHLLPRLLRRGTAAGIMAGGVGGAGTARRLFIMALTAMVAAVGSRPPGGRGGAGCAERHLHGRKLREAPDEKSGALNFSSISYFHLLDMFPPRANAYHCAGRTFCR